ncbi:MAG TPA: thrombospondin type 3 repeat-containing protein, partial [Pseudomonadales bacterium]|nr:thrombospondin type 3 repeat-containing protein [Pseudomonadales bacterium]
MGYNIFRRLIVTLAIMFPLLASAAITERTKAERHATGSAGFDELLGQQIHPGTFATESRSDGTFILTNAMQTVSAHITPQGVVFDSIGNSVGKGGFGLRLKQWGREGALQTVSSSKIYRDGDVVYHTFSGGIAEKFSNTHDGIRQDFIVPLKPAGNGVLQVQISIDDAKLTSKESGLTVTLNHSGRRLTYDRLKVTDANNKIIPAKIIIPANAESLAENKFTIVVDDSTAQYPLMIDPTVGDENWIAAGGSIVGANANVYAVVSNGTDVYIGGSFTLVGDTAANYVARWDGSHWNTLGSGLNGQVRSLALDGAGNLYVAGLFTAAGGVSASGIAKWNGVSWSALGAGITGIQALTVDAAGNVYAGGGFNYSGALGRVAKWDGVSWSGLGVGMNSSVYALTFDSNGVLYAGGDFTNAGGVSANRIAKWDGTNWSALGSGFSATVRALSVDSSNALYAGGLFSGYIQKWNGSAWSVLGSGMNNAVYALLADPVGNIYAAGDFTIAGGVGINRIAKWNGVSWNKVATSGSNALVRTMALDQAGQLYAGGDFTSLGSASKIARFDGSKWFSMGAPSTQGANDAVLAFAEDATGNFYIAGKFTNIAGVSANSIAKWNGSSWSALGPGISQNVYALATDSIGNLYAGIGGSGTGVMKWDGSQWSTLPYVNGAVYSLVVDSHDTLYVGGDFQYAGGKTVNGVAQWDGSTWDDLYSGSNLGADGSVLAMAIDKQDNLYVAATAYLATPTAKVTKWNGSAWSRLGTTTMNDTIRALAVDSTGIVYAGGEFTLIGTSSISRIAQWDGSAWNKVAPPAGSGINGDISALAVDSNDVLYAGGSFTFAAGVPVSNIARWNGTEWAALGSGVNNTVLALMVDKQGNLQVGGQFVAAGNKASMNRAEWLVADIDDDGIGDGIDADADNDGLNDASDNCPLNAAADQLDTDGDGKGDACDDDIDNDGLANTDDAFPLDSSQVGDVDGDGVDGFADNCPGNANTDQLDTDGDGKGDVCDSDDDNDGVADIADKYPRNPAASSDSDNDGSPNTWTAICDAACQSASGLALDNCPDQANADQLNTDSDSQGDTCDADDDNDGTNDSSDKFPLNPAASVDTDNDGFPNNWRSACNATCQANSGLILDNCPSASNPDQLNTDGDAQGNACDTDDDNDGVADASDAFPLNAAESADTDTDGVGNNADNCVALSNASQTDTDVDGAGDECDSTPNGDTDNDTIDNLSDNCVSVSNTDQLNTDGDIQGNACDNDDDNDGVPDVSDAFPLDASESVDTDGDGIGDNADNCSLISNADQLNTDGDAQGDVCDVFVNDPALLLQQHGTAKGEQLGSSVAMADINKDGVVDLLVGSPMANFLSSGKILKKSGKIQIVSGKDNAVIRTINGSAANQQLGTAIAVVPDQNKDGVLDIVVGDPLADVVKMMPTGFQTLKDAGRVLLYSGSDGRML